MLLPLSDDFFSIEYVETKEAIDNVHKFLCLPLNKIFNSENCFSINVDKNMIIF